MKTIKFKRLEIKDFQGISQFEFDFKDGTTKLLGTNASGKSSVIDAILWIITSKNQRDQSDSSFQIVPLDKEGRMIPTAEPHGKLTIEIDGKETTIERKLILKVPKTKDGVIDYTTRFKPERKFFIDGLNFKATQFNAEIQKIFGDENTFKMLTNVVHFGLNMSEKKQRELLLSYIKPVTYEMLCNIDERFKTLNELEKLDFNDVLTQTRTKIKGNSDDLVTIKARIDEKKLDLAQFGDVDLSKLGELETKRSKIQNEITKLNDTMKEQDDNKSAKNQLDRDLMAVEYDIKNFNTDFDRTKQMNIEGITRQITNAENDIQRCENKRERLVEAFDAEDLKITNVNASVDESIEIQIKELKEENTNHITRIANQYEGSGLKSDIAELTEKVVIDTCYVCEQALPLEKVAQAQSKIDEDIEKIQTKLTNLFKEKETKLLELNTKHKEELLSLQDSRDSKIKSRVASFERQIEEIQKSGRDNNTEKEGYILSKSNLENDLKLEKETQVNQTEKDMLFSKKEKIEKDISKLGGSDTVSFNDVQNKQIVLDDLNNKLNSKDEITRDQTRLKTLTKEQKSKIKGLSDLEEKKLLLDDYLKTKNNLLSGELKKHFTDDITFKFLEFTQDGTPKDTFKMLINGVPYSGANTAGKIIAGQQMILFFQKRLEIQLPILIDNKESVVVDLPEFDGQIVECLADNKYNKLTVE
jgi:DNA repair exonuclease SbcCD ATPase subunit